MKRALLLFLTGCVLLGATVLSRQQDASAPDPHLQVRVEPTNPWTHLRLKNRPKDFQFVLVTDRTGGHRAHIFSRAVEQINLLHPEFVLSVGDLIEGYTEDMKKVDAEWKELRGYVERLEMPFFYVPGNHDITNVKMEEKWKELFGRRYYFFVYHDVLFLILNSEDPPTGDKAKIDKEQLAWAKEVLEKHKEVRWTIVAVHKPMWAYADVKTNGWLEVEKLLEGRKYTVFAGHYHKYHKYVRGGMSYYQLATTGGASRLRGPRYGEIDHLTWVTMTDEGPRLANIRLDGILPETLELPETEEKAHPSKRLKTFPVRGTVTRKGEPLPEAELVFYYIDHEAKGNLRRAGDALTEQDGTYKLTTYENFDGAPEGDYLVTIIQRKPRYDDKGIPGPNKLPQKLAKPRTSGLRVSVDKEKENVIDFKLTR